MQNVAVDVTVLSSKAGILNTQQKHDVASVKCWNEHVWNIYVILCVRCKKSFISKDMSGVVLWGLLTMTKI